MAEEANVPRGSLVDHVYARLLEQVMDGSLPPGAQLRLGRLAATLGVSQTPIREALARLEGQSLVVRAPMRGFAVAQPLGVDDLDQLTQTRLLIEPAVTAEAVRAGGQVLVHRLQKNWQRSAAIEVGRGFEGYRGYLELSADFHEVISAACPNRYLRDALATLPIHLQRFRLFGADGVTDREVGLAEHLEVLEAVRSGDPDTAAHAMRRHVMAVHERSRRSIVEGGGLSSGQVLGDS